MITVNQSIPKKTAQYLSAQSVFYEQFNEVQFYFEDAQKEELYYLIFKKLFSDINFTKVFGLNGKVSVIEKAEKSINKKNRVFIVDKDFDDLLGLKRTNLKNLFYLDRYSIENYFFEEEAIKKFIISQMPNRNRNTINFKLSPLIRKIIQKLKYLTIYFFVAHKNQIPYFESCSLPLERFTRNLNPTEIDSGKVKAYRISLRLGLVAIKCPNTYSSEIARAKRLLVFESETIFKHIPGKHCIKLLMKILKERFPKIGNLEFNRVCYALADKCLFHSLDNLKNAINNYIIAA
jgi:hypothetical protein